MHRQRLGTSDLWISRISFGAGPVPGLMTNDDSELHQQAVRRAVDSGINWFDTAATYADGASERGLGRALRTCGLRAAGGEGDVHVATKVRLFPDQLDAIEQHVRQSVEGSLARLGIERIALLQVHNSLTARRGDLHTSLTPDDVLGTGGVLAAFERLRDEGLVRHFGLTGLGDAGSLRQVIHSQAFVSLQGPYSLVNPSFGRRMPGGWSESDYQNLLDDCQKCGVGFLAIRVLAGGALACQPPSEHTRQTRFFPLDLYQRDQARARSIAAHLPDGMPLPTASIRWVLSDPRVASALIGFSSAQDVTAAVADEANGPLRAALLDCLDKSW